MPVAGKPGCVSLRVAVVAPALPYTHLLPGGLPMRTLTTRTAVLTGASRGLGPYMARALAAEGMNLVLAARTADALEEVATEIRARGRRALPVACDVVSAGDRQKLVDAATAEFGAIDVLVN